MIWTKEETELLKRTYEDSPNPFDLIPNRTRAAIRKKAKKLGLNRQLWSEKELKILKANYSQKGPTKLAKILNKTKSQIFTKAKTLGLKYIEDLWTPKDDKYLIENYAHKTAKQLGTELGRSRSAISARVKRLKLKKEDRVEWSKKEEEILYATYSTKTTDQLIKLLPNRSSNAIHARASLLEIKKEKLYRSYTRIKSGVNVDFFADGIVSEDHAALLGYLYADGNLYGSRLQFACKVDDREYLEKIAKLLNFNGEIGTRNRSVKKIADTIYNPPIRLQSSRMTISSLKLTDDLKKLGLKRNKTLTLTPPTSLNGFEAGFIRGFFDGDGGISGKSPTVGFTGASKEFIFWVRKTVALHCGLTETKLNVRTHETYANSYQLVWGGRFQVAKIGWWMYGHVAKGNSKLFMKRKWDRFVPLWKDQGYL